MPPPPPFRVSHIVLDVSGTLIDFDTAIRAALETAALRVSELLATTVGPDALSAERERVAVDPAWRGRTPRAIRDESFRRVLAGSDAASDAAVAELAALYNRVRDASSRPFPEVASVLDTLVARGFTLVAATNGNAALSGHPFFARFAHVHVAELAGVAKPDPRFFAGALAASGGRPAAAISVGDRLDNDYLPARAAGMYAVLVDRTGSVNEPAIACITSLAELPDLVELL
jgi:putative hydrolase of the HAD superfamily